MNDKLTIDFNTLNINELSFEKIDNSDYLNYSIKYNNNKFNIVPLPIRFTNKYYYNFNFPTNDLLLPIDNDLTEKLIEIQNFVNSNEFKKKLNIPNDISFVNFIKEQKGIKILKTKIFYTKVSKTYTYKNNPDKIYKKNITWHTPHDIYELLTKNISINCKIVPNKLWISTELKKYGMQFIITDINLNYDNLIINDMKTNYGYQFVLLDESDI